MVQRPTRGPKCRLTICFARCRTCSRPGRRVILSGGGTDGTLGFQSIKARRGITFAQDEKTAKSASRPRSAVADGCVDYVLPPGEIARQLVRLTNHSYARQAEADPAASPTQGDAMHGITELLRAVKDVDFSHYKQTTIRRRIQRRMALRGIDDDAKYLRLLREDAAELNDLFQDFLIRVTQFFRDPEAFEALKEKVLPQLLTGRVADRPLRIWVTGCSTGEEAYSLAILLLEVLGSREDAPPIKILATDLNEAALEKARAGVYIDNIEMDVSPERLRRFFVRSDGKYVISKSIRELCLFSRHNLASDPPFSHLDLVSCRNVLIYMDLALQKRILPILHYSLCANGFLFLGASESIGLLPEMFTVVDAKHRLFQKKLVAHGAPLDFRAYAASDGVERRGLRTDTVPVWSALDVQKEADRIVLARFAPVRVVVDETMTVLQFRAERLLLEPARAWQPRPLPDAAGAARGVLAVRKPGRERDRDARRPSGDGGWAVARAGGSDSVHGASAGVASF